MLFTGLRSSPYVQSGSYLYFLFKIWNYGTTKCHWISTSFFNLFDLAGIERGVLKSPTMRKDLSVLLYDSINFWFISFEAILLVICNFRIVTSSWGIEMFLLILGHSLSIRMFCFVLFFCLKVYLIHYYYTYPNSVLTSIGMVSFPFLLFSIDIYFPRSVLPP